MAKKVTEPLGTSVTVKTLEILLDDQNPRIEVKTGASQETIREKLLTEENVVELAKDIIRNSGLMLGERIIVVNENGKYVVLEGNRRTCACQLLVNPSLIPKSQQGKFPAADDELKGKLKIIHADLAATREEAESTITKRHTESGIKQWTPQAKQRRIARMIKAGKSISEVAELFKSNEAGIRKTLREYALLERARNLKCWTKPERDVLQQPDLATNPYTRFFTLKDSKARIPLTIDDQGTICSTVDDKVLDDVVEGLARALLLPSSKFNTRSTASEVFKSVAQSKPALRKLLVDDPAKTTQPSASTTPKGPQLSAKADKFFESLVCPIQDNALINVSQEIRDISYKTYKTSATFLLRVLIETTLTYCINQKGLWKTLMAEFHTSKAPTPQQETCPGCQHTWTPAPKKTMNVNKEPGLDFIISFCMKHQGELFIGNVQRVLEQWKTLKDVADLVIHGKWIEANASRLEHAASVVRPFITKVFDGSVLKP